MGRLCMYFKWNRYKIYLRRILSGVAKLSKSSISTTACCDCSLAASVRSSALRKYPRMTFSNEPTLTWTTTNTTTVVRYPAVGKRETTHYNTEQSQLTDWNMFLYWNNPSLAMCDFLRSTHSSKYLNMIGSSTLSLQLYAHFLFRNTS